MMTDTTVAVLKPHPTLSALRGAVLVMEAAELAGLPVPTHVTTSSYAAVRFGGETTVSFQPDSLDDLRTWAEWLDAPVTARPNGDTVQHWCEAAVFDQRVHLAFIEDVTA
jgi:hypothetical protein